MNEYRVPADLIQPSAFQPSALFFQLRFSGRDRETCCEERFVVDFDQNRVVAGLRKTEIADLVDEVDALQRALRFEIALDQWRETG